MNHNNKKSSLCLILLLVFTCINGENVVVKRLPNIIIVYTDDLGYGDLGCYGNPTIRTPHLDKIASEGIKFTQFYVAAPVCSPSRAALLTGCYPKRVGLHEGVLRGSSKTGLNPSEVTIAEQLKKNGYTTACFGKWHLGHQNKFLPTNQGFDVFWGIPFSNDMSRKEQAILGNNNYKYQLPVISQTDTIELDPDQELFTKRLTKRTLDFIKNNFEVPFFIYLAHPMPHVPVYASKDFQGKSRRGKYGDTVEEIDWSVGEIMETLKKYNIDKNTLVLFSSDNGPWKDYKTEGGSAGSLRGGKGSTWEGGMREPFIAWWPGTIKPQTTCSEVVTNMDILPTLSRLAGVKLPENKIDGRDISVLFKNPITHMKTRPFYYYSSNGILEGIRLGALKLIKRGDNIQLYNLDEDFSEEYDLASKYPVEVAKLKTLMEDFDKSMDIENRMVGYIE